MLINYPVRAKVRMASPNFEDIGAALRASCR